MSATQLVVVCVLIVCLVGHLGIAGAYGVSCEGNCVNGHGVLTSPHEGEFKDGKKTGTAFTRGRTDSGTKGSSRTAK